MKQRIEKYNWKQILHCSLFTKILIIFFLYEFIVIIIYYKKKCNPYFSTYKI